MSSPRPANLRTSGGIYELAWPDIQLLMRCDRLHQDSRFNLTTEITIKSTMPGVAQHVHQARLNLTSTTARRTLIRELESRIPDYPWPSLVEELAVRVLEAHRQGEPVIALADYSPTEALDFRLTPILQEQQSTVFYGQGESGKTWIGLFIACLLTLPLPALGWQPEPGPVLYLDYETDPDTGWDRINMITKGLNAPIPDHLYWRQMLHPLAGDIEIIQREVLEKGIVLVVVDSAALACMEPEKSELTIPYFAALRSLKCTTLTIAHTEASGRQDRPFGSIFWRNLPRANFRLRSNSDSGNDDLVVGIKQTKGNNRRRLQDIGVKLSFSSFDNAVSFSRVDVADVEELANTLPLKTRIAHLLRKGALTSTELADQLGVPAQQIRNTLSNGHHKEFIMLTSPDTHLTRWGLRDNLDEARI